MSFLQSVFIMSFENVHFSVISVVVVHKKKWVTVLMSLALTVSSNQCRDVYSSYFSLNNLLLLKESDI